MKLYDILNAKSALQTLVQENMPIKAAYRMQKAIRKVDQELREYEQVYRELVKKYGNEVFDWEIPTKNQHAYDKAADQPNANLEALKEKFGERVSKGWQVANENLEVFRKEHTELVESEIELEFQPVPLEWLNGVQMRTTDMLAVAWLFEEKEDQDG